MTFFKKKKNNNVAGILGAALVGVGVAAAALLSDKKTRAKVKKTVSTAKKKAEVSVRQLEKKLADRKPVSKPNVVKKAKVTKKDSKKKA